MFNWILGHPERKREKEVKVTVRFEIFRATPNHTTFDLFDKYFIVKMFLVYKSAKLLSLKR